MASFTRSRIWFSIVLSLAALTSPAVAVSQSLCSSDNTGSDYNPLNSIYLSAGKCSDNCNGYAFAVVQGKNCWCSNFAPGDTVSTGNCGQGCPGYPYEQCGGDGVYGYIALAKEPEGTIGGSTPTSEVVTPQPTTVQPETTETTPTTTPTPTPTTPTTTTRRRPTYTPTSTSETSTSSWSPIPYPSVRTIQGAVQTVTVTPTAPPQAAATTSDPEVQSESKGGFWGNTGKVAGTFTAVGIIIAALIGAAIFFFLRKRSSQNKAMTVASFDDDVPTSGNDHAPYMVDRRRSNLTLATTGLAGLTRGSSNEKSPNDKTPGSLSRRGSIPMHDQRLNPAALWNTAHPNGSHASVASFRDDQDYSRPVLHVRNPDVD